MLHFPQRRKNRRYGSPLRHQGDHNGSKMKRFANLPRGGSVDTRRRRDEKWTAKLLRFFVWSILAFGILGGAGGAILVATVNSSLPDPDKLTDRVVAQSTKIYDRTGEHLLYEIFSDQKRTLVELEEIPTFAIHATIAVEDKKFFEHKGVRWISIARAAINNVLGRQAGSGGASTLTQQLVKNAIVGDEHSYIRKLKEAILASKIEKTYTKNQILKLYFNEIPYGSSNYGIEAAAQSYFGKTVHDITLAEAAALAALPKAPTRYLNNVEALKNRRDFILKSMANEGYITPAQTRMAQQEPLELKERLSSIQAPHFVLYIKELLTGQFGEKMVETGGLEVTTSLDYTLQTIAEEEIKKGCEHNTKNNNATNAALAALDTRTGEILAMVGSCDYFNDDIDGQVNVTLRPRQPGSSFKPFVYLTGFDNGYTPQTILYDTVTNFAASGDPYEPHNYDSKEHGPVTVRRALQNSLNIPAVKMLYLSGVNKVLENAQKAGYTTLNEPERFGLSLVLGGAEVKLLEHVNAYATLADRGKYKSTVGILEVRDENGLRFEHEKEQPNQVLNKEAVATLTSVLADDSARAAVFGAGGVLTLPDRPVAAKTGTTNEYHDGWTLGFTPSLVAGVWVGNNDNTAMRRGVGGSVGAGPIWQGFMKRALAGKPVENFPEPPKNKNSKPILNGNDDGGVSVRIDTVSGKRATEDTPEELVQEMVFLQPHSILHYVQKEDPEGPMPVNPSQDPQYDAWESGVQKWIEQKRQEAEEKGEELTFILGDPPTEFDDVHRHDLRPSLTVNHPQAQTVIRDKILETSLEVNAPRGVARVVYLLDGMFLGAQTKYPFRLTKNIEDFGNGQHTLTVKAYDDVSNLTIVEVPFTLEAPLSPPDAVWTAPRLNATLFASLFPITLQLRTTRTDEIESITVLSQDETSEKPSIIGSIQNPGQTIEVSWNETPSPGIHLLKTSLRLKDGSILYGQLNTITVRE